MGDLERRTCDGRWRPSPRGFAAQRGERQQRVGLERADLDALAGAGLQRTGLPAERGGLWQDLATSTRPICEIYRALAAVTRRWP